ncbi:transcriptional regulator, LacI family [Xaviernesmea oryzae]|uniref:Transcriptional regulator, LacI family n=1 Tax=Xaviernesmea oryzae TaxID=464029 RepID=A0A1X7DDE8_9HYPH|nr:substrate-binding domain-containing protein [Xaviernesmea oryzae]SMF12846.1 transcriptional regulator, LacI family [Xaviernesmea oryzae]
MAGKATQAETLAKRVSIADVAKLAGCAPATVSRRLNNPEIVSPSVVESIDHAIQALGYVRNGSARQLRSSRSHLVGAIIPTIRHSIYAEMLAGLQQSLERNGFALIYSTSEYDLDEEYKQALTLVERGIEALVLVGTRHRSKTFDLLNTHNVSCAVTYALQKDFNYTSIGFDNYRAAALAAQRLWALGHRTFGMIAGITTNNDRAQARVAGFTDTLLGLGATRDDVIIREAPYQIGAGRQMMASLLVAAPQISAVFCGSDVLAIGAMSELRSQGISVPDRCSIIGFDNLEIAAYVDPPLSTLNVPAYEMGVETGEWVVRSEPGKVIPRKVELDVEYVERGTTAKAPPR